MVVACGGERTGERALVWWWWALSLCGKEEAVLWAPGLQQTDRGARRSESTAKRGGAAKVDPSAECQLSDQSNRSTRMNGLL